MLVIARDPGRLIPAPPTVIPEVYSQHWAPTDQAIVPKVQPGCRAVQTWCGKPGAGKRLQATQSGWWEGCLRLNIRSVGNSTSPKNFIYLRWTLKSIRPTVSSLSKATGHYHADVPVRYHPSRDWNTNRLVVLRNFCPYVCCKEGGHLRNEETKEMTPRDPKLMDVQPPNILTK